MTLEKNLVGDTVASSYDILRTTPIDEMDGVVAELKKHRPADDVCEALVRLIGVLPLEHFQRLRDVYRKHCA